MFIKKETVYSFFVTPLDEWVSYLRLKVGSGKVLGLCEIFNCPLVHIQFGFQIYVSYIYFI